MEKLRIYVAGPLTNNDPVIVQRNILVAKKIGEELLKMGHLPYVPHKHFSGWDVDIFKYYEVFFEHGCLILEKWANALYFIGESRGANKERKIAEQLCYPIFESLDEVIEYSKERV